MAATYWAATWTALFALASGNAQANGWHYAAAATAGTATHESRIDSLNSLTLRFPYDGKNHGSLTVRSQPDHAVLTVDKGQILCYLAPSCSIKIQFDDGPVQTFYGRVPSDGGPSKVVLAPTLRFLAAARAAKRLRVAVSLYEGGEQVLEFRAPEPLVWPPASSQSPIFKSTSAALERP